MKHKITAFLAFIILVAGISALALLAGALGNNLINICQFLGGTGVTVTTLFLDVKWIDKHFVDGEWV